MVNVSGQMQFSWSIEVHVLHTQNILQLVYYNYYKEEKGYLLTYTTILPVICIRKAYELTFHKLLSGKWWMGNYYFVL